MKTELRRLIFSALLLSGTSMTFAQNGATTVVGDLPGYEKSETKTEAKTEAKAAKTQDAVRVGDLDSKPDGPVTTVSDLDTNYVGDSEPNVVTDLSPNIVSDVVPGFSTDSGSRSGTVVIGLAPSMVTDLPASTRSNFVEAVPLPILMETKPPTPPLPIPTSKSDAAEATGTAKDKPKDKPKDKDKDKGTNSKADAKEGKQKESDELQTVDVQPFKPIAFQTNKTETADCDCGQTCDGGCNASSPSKRTSRFSGIFDRCPDQSWFSSEFLLWSMQDRNSPPLVTTSPSGTFPILPGAEVVYGDKLKGEFSGGYRLDAGKFLTDNFAVGGRFWILGENNDSFFRDVRPSQYYMGRPFFNALVGIEDVLLVSGINGGVLGAGDFEGAIAANSDVNVWAAEAYTRLRLNCNSLCKFEFISGYSHFSLDDKLSISSLTFDTNTTAYYQFNDFFDTKNRFHGGQLGFETSLSEGRWTFRSLTKVHLGNMNQRVMIAGNHKLFNGVATSTGSGGLLAMGNQGNYERNEFSFIPEVNLKLEYCVRKNVALTLGYSFLYFDKLALSGAQVDRIINPTTLGVSGPPWPARPAFSFKDSSMWVQGIDFGLRMDF